MHCNRLVMLHVGSNDKGAAVAFSCMTADIGRTSSGQQKWTMMMTMNSKVVWSQQRICMYDDAFMKNVSTFPSTF